jgi:hypothetical protein
MPVALSLSIANIGCLFMIKDAISLLQSTVEAKQDTYGDLSARVADAWKLIGNCYLATGDSSRALQALKKVRCAFISNIILFIAASNKLSISWTWIFMSHLILYSSYQSSSRSTMLRCRNMQMFETRLNQNPSTEQ